MLTPLDIESKEFSTSVGGYSKADVNLFKREVLKSYEQIYKENIEMKDKINMLNEGIQYYKTIEDTLQNTLLLAEKAAEEAKSAARSKSESIEKEAELAAQKIIRQAKEEVYQISQMRETLMRSYESVKIQLKQFLGAQMEILEKNELQISQNTSETEDVLSKINKELHERQNENGFQSPVSSSMSNQNDYQDNNQEEEKGFTYGNDIN